MIACPNISHPDYKYAVEQLGKETALYLYDLLGQQIPTNEQVDSYLDSIEDEYEGIVQEDLSEYGSITVGSKFEGKQELLDKFGIKKSRSHYYYVLSKEEQKRLDTYVTGKWTRGKLGRTRKGFEISDTINGRVRYKYINNKPYLLIDVKEIFEEDGIKLPRKIGSFKVPIDLVYFGDESDYKEFQKKNINYIPYLEKEINKYLFKTKAISLAKSMNFYAYKTSKLLIDLFKEVFNKDVTLEQLFNSNIEELKQLLDSDVFKNKLKDIQNQYKEEINQLDADVIRQDILDRFNEAEFTSDNETYKLFDEQFINDLSVLLNYLPDNFIKLVSIDVIYSQTAMFIPQTRSNQKSNISKDSLTKLILLNPFRESMSINITLKRLYDKGIITNEDIDEANKLLKPGIKKFIEDTGGDYTISKKRYYNKLEILHSVLGTDKYKSFEKEQYYVLSEIDDYNRTKLYGFTTLIHGLLEVPNFSKINDVFGAIKLGNFTKFKGSFTPDNMTIIGHEIGHGIDRYIATVKPKVRKDIISFINDLIETKEFKNYIKKGLESRGYDITNKKEITADLFAYIALRSINYSGINEGHLKSLNEFFNNNEILITNIFNKYSFDGFNSLEGNTPIKKQTIFDVLRDIINDIIDAINNLIGKNIFNKLTTNEPSLTTTIPFGKATIEDIYTIFNNLITDKSLYEINNIFNADPQFQAEWNKYGSITKNEPETKEQFIERMNSRIENGKYKQRDDTLVDVTDSYNPETWWVEKQEKLVKFEGKNRETTLFTFDKVNEKLSSLAKQYGPEGYSFKREQVVFPVGGTQRSTTKNFAPNNRKIWKITVTKPLNPHLEEMFTMDDVKSVVDYSNTETEKLFDVIQNKPIEEVFDYLDSIEIPEEYKTMLKILKRKLADNPTLNIKLVPEYYGKYGYFDFNTNTVFIDKVYHLNKNHFDLAEVSNTLIHELLHAFTLRAMRNAYTDSEIEFKMAIDRLYSIALKETNRKYHPAYRSAEEFLAYVLTDPDIMQEAMGMKLNLWQRFLRALHRFLTGSSVYDIAFKEVVEYIGKADTFEYTSKNYDVVNREASEDIYLNKDNITHKEIWEKLNQFSNMFVFDKPTHTYTLVKDIDGNDLKEEDQVKFTSVTEAMKRARILSEDRVNPDPEIAARNERGKKRATGIGNVIHAISETDLKQIAIDLSQANGIEFTQDVVNTITNILKNFKNKNVTLLSEVLVADLDLQIAGFIDLLVIDKDNNFHIYDFKTKEKGFSEYLIKKKYGGAQRMSDKERHEVQLSMYKDLLEKMTGIKVNTINIIPLVPTIVDNSIVDIRLDRTHSKTGSIPMTYNNNASFVYMMRKSELSKGGKTIDNLSDSIKDTLSDEYIKERDEQFKEDLKNLYKSKTNLSPQEEIVRKSLEALTFKKQILYRSAGRNEIESIDKVLADVLAETDVEKQLKILVDFAYHTANRIQYEYNKYTKDGRTVPLNLLRGWRDSILAFDAILNEEDGLYNVLFKEHGFKGGPEYRDALDKTMKMGNSIKSLYKDLGSEQLVEFLTPFYHMAYAEMRLLKTKEYRRKKFLNQIPAGVTEKDYVEKYIDENEETLQDRTKNLLRSEIKKASRDIGVLTRWIDNLLDTKDPITAAMIKAFVYADDKARIESLDKRQEVAELARKVENWYKENGGIPKSMEDFYGFMLEKIDDKYTGNYITPYLSTMMSDYKDILSASRSIEDLDNRKDFVNAWLNGTTDMPGNWPLNKDAFIQAYFEFIDQQHDEGNISDSEYDNLYANQNFKNKATVRQMVESTALSFETGELLDRWLSNNVQSFREPHPTKWANSQWVNLKKILDNPKDPRGDLYRFIQSMRMEADSFIPFGYRLDSRLPGVVKQDYERIQSGQGVGSIIRGALSRRFTFKIDDTTRVHEELLDSAGNPRYFLPVHFTGRITKEVKEIVEGEEKTYRVFDPDEQSFDLLGIYYQYWSMANDYNHKQEILPQMEMAKFIINHRPTVKRDSLGNAVLRKIGGKVSDIPDEEQKAREQTINNSNLAEQVNDWFLSCVYGMYEKDAGMWGKVDVTKLLNFINSYTSINLLGINFVAGTANVILGETLQRIESFAKEYMTPGDFAYADKFHLRTLGGVLGDIGSRSSSGLGTNIIEFFGILDDYGRTNMDVRTKFAQMMHSDALYFTSHAGEHYMQSRFLFGMLANKQMKGLDGKPIGRLLDQYEMKDGKLKLKQESTMSEVDYASFLKINKWTEDDQQAFKMKVRGILSRLHGEYSNLGRIAIQRSALGRMAYLFRHFIVTGFRRRYGKGMYKFEIVIEDGKKVKRKVLRPEAYMERLGQFVEGNYVTTGKYIGATVGKLFTKNEEHPELAFFQRLIPNLQSFKMSIFKSEWAELTDHEKANIQRTLYEVGFLVIAVIMANIAMGFKVEADDDDDEFQSRYWAFLAYQSYRLQNELLFFSPKLDSAMSILRSPAASMSVVENLIDLSGQIVHPTDRYETGAWKGRLKIMKTLNNMVPLQRQFYRLGEMETVLPWMYKTSLSGTPKSVDERYTTVTNTGEQIK